MSPDTRSIPGTWTIFGVAGPRRAIGPDSVTRTDGGITYAAASFPAELNPSPLIGNYTNQRDIKVLDRFAKACGVIRRSCLNNPRCTGYFRKLGGNLSLEDLFGWKIEFGYWKPTERVGALPQPGDSVGVLQAEVIRTIPHMSYALIIISETSLVSDTKLAATLVHELAHVAGAPGATGPQKDEALSGSNPRLYKKLIAAEEALKHCMLGGEFHREAVGAIFDIREQQRRTMA